MGNLPTYKGLRPHQGWSIHMTGGWRTQLDRVQRWHSRIQTASTQQDTNDFLYAFFENAFHLRDWLSDTGAVTKEQLDALFSSSVEMRLCRDLANAHKHFSLNRPSQPEPPSEAREYVPGNRHQGPSTRLVVISEWEKYDPIELAGAVLACWEKFIMDTVSEPAT
jgi:hypothetical protein